MKKKSLLILICIFCVAAVSVFGTLAYLTDRDSVVNTFTIGHVNIELDEAAVDADGQLILDDEGEPVDRVKGNEYHLIPGKSYIKDPTITIQANSEESYIRMILTIHNASTVQAMIDSHQLGDFAALIGGWDKTIWLYQGFIEDETANTISFEFRYKEAVGADSVAVKLSPLFETLIVPGEVNATDLKVLHDPNEDGNYDDGFKMVITGHAIQKAGFDDADAAWTAFDEQIVATAVQP